jgi:hypothetical protein
MQHYAVVRHGATVLNAHVWADGSAAALHAGGEDGLAAASAAPATVEAKYSDAATADMTLTQDSFVVGDVESEPLDYEVASTSKDSESVASCPICHVRYPHSHNPLD